MTEDERQQEQQQRWSYRTLPVREEAWRPGAMEFARDTRELAREKPVAAVLTAAGLGYLVARFVSRVSR